MFQLTWVFPLCLALVSWEARAFLLFSDSAIRQCSLKDARKDEFRICFRGSATRPDFERHKEYAVRAAFTWLKVYKTMDFEVTTRVAISCQSPAISINILNGNGRSYARPSEAWLYSQVNQSTWVHEFLHAMAGLADTYSGSSACVCQRGQPISNACCGGYGPRADHTKWSTLFDDDIDGAKVAYRKVFGHSLMPTLRAPDFSLFTPIDLANPFEHLNLEEDFSVSHIEDHQVFVVDGPATPIDHKAEFD